MGKTCGGDKKSHLYIFFNIITFLNNTNLFKKTISVNCINGTRDISYNENSDIKDNIESLMNELDMLKL